MLIKDMDLGLAIEIAKRIVIIALPFVPLVSTAIWFGKKRRL